MFIRRNLEPKPIVDDWNSFSAHQRTMNHLSDDAIPRDLDSYLWEVSQSGELGRGLIRASHVGLRDRTAMSH